MTAQFTLTIHSKTRSDVGDGRATVFASSRVTWRGPVRIAWRELETLEEKLFKAGEFPTISQKLKLVDFFRRAPFSVAVLFNSFGRPMSVLAITNA